MHQHTVVFSLIFSVFPPCMIKAASAAARPSPIENTFALTYPGLPDRVGVATEKIIESVEADELWRRRY